MRWCSSTPAAMTGRLAAFGLPTHPIRKRPSPSAALTTTVPHRRKGDVALTLPAGAAAEITARQLEAGAGHFDGRFGAGKGKWRLFIEADQDIQAMSLLESPTGHVTNLSAGAALQ